MDFIFLDILNNYPMAAHALMVIGAFRLVAKPLCSALHTYVDLTPSPKDNEILAKVEGNKYVKAFFYCLDWFLSIKAKNAAASNSEANK